LAEEKHYTMYDEMLEKYQVEYSGGGSVQNAARIFQWLVGMPNAATFVGCIGKDKFGETLTEVSRKAGVNVQYMIHPTEPTGKCAVLVTGTNRSLCAYLAAANFFKKEHLEDPAVDTLMRKADYFYIEGYHLTVSPESILHIAQYACSSNKVVCINLSAPFLITVFRDPMMKVLPFVDVIICNEAEAETFSEEHKFGSKALCDIALKLLALPKENEKRERLVVVTHGSQPITVAHEGKIQEYPIPPIDTSKIVDTNGAGDGFAGGFLAMYVQGQPIETCIRCGIYAATEVIGQDGCTVPEVAKFEI